MLYRRGGILSGKIDFEGGKKPGKNSVSELKDGEKILYPRVWKGKKEIQREAPKNFLADMKYYEI
jgi:hypothetical protein